MSSCLAFSEKATKAKIPALSFFGSLADIHRGLVNFTLKKKRAKISRIEPPPWLAGATGGSWYNLGVVGGWEVGDYGKVVK